MTYITIYSDFDGTITKQSGNNTVFHRFYRSLLDSGNQYNYKTDPMKAAAEVQALFKAKFGHFDENFNFSQRDAEFLMSQETLNFFHQLLFEERVRINIVTKNREDYVRALFQYQGFTEEEIARLNIMHSGNKSLEVSKDLKNTIPKPDHLYILDDNEEDFNSMYNAALNQGYRAEQITGYRLQPGQFEWSQYLEEIQELSKKNEINFEAKQKKEEEEDDLIENFIPRSSWSSSIRSKGAIILIAVVFGALGLKIGLPIGLALASTGVFAPFGVGIIGALALGLLFGLCSACLLTAFALAVHYVILNRARLMPNCSKEEDLPHSYVTMQNLGFAASEETEKETRPVAEVGDYYSSDIKPLSPAPESELELELEPERTCSYCF